MDTEGHEQIQGLTNGVSLDHRINAFEKKCIRKALYEAGGNMSKAAKLLGITYRSIRYRIKKLSIIK